MKIPNFSKKQSIAILLLVILIGLPEIYLFIPYFLVIKPGGERNINAILSEVKGINETDKKLERVVEWETDGYTETFGNTPSFKIPGVLRWLGAGYDVYLIFSDTQPIKIRPNSVIFYNDPYWIAYFKTGACGERAYLFNYVANQSGQVTRVVNAPGNDHAWVEIYNGTDWIYADPTFYFHYNNSPGREKGWTGATSNLQKFWGWNLTKVVTNSNETNELTSQYTNVGNMSIIYTMANHVYVNRYLAGEQRNVTLFSKYGSPTQEAENVTYQLGLSNDYIVTAEKFNYPFPSKWVDERIITLANASVTLVMNPERGREEMDYMAIAVLVIIGIVFPLLFYRMFKARKKEKEG
jgi:hypothetical protein